MARMKYESAASRKSKKSNKAPHKLDDLRKVLNVYAQEANERVSQLIDSGVESAALLKAYKSLRKQDKENFDNDETGGVLFNVSNKTRYRELQREAARIESFLAESSSLVSVATAEQKAMDAYKKHGLSFHNQADEETGLDNVRFRGWDQNRIKLALEIYRRLESTNNGATLIYGLNGKGGFGSDNLFNLIFDEIEGYDPNMSDKQRDKVIGKALQTGMAALDEFQHADMFGFLKGSPRSRKREQNVLSEMAKSQSAESFFKRNKWLNKRSW